MPARVLIVETDALFRRTISQRLVQEGYTVLEAGDEAQAKKIVRKTSIDVCLLGLKGLKTQGLSLLRSIKTVRPMAAVILMTPAESLSLSIEGMQLGAFDDLFMPFNVETLLSRVREAYRVKLAQKAKRRMRVGRRQGKSPAGREVRPPAAGAGEPGPERRGKSKREEEDI